jgi:transcriptional regulator with GAF, ATPase, and Fis domain
LNCAALTESLLENELFGHTRGAFTGAAAPRSGLIEHASGGTLFLDEIGTMSTALQAKLLRAVESGEVRRIGENESRRVDVRFVTATNVDLKPAVDGGSFRSDLYYRVNVHRVHMPPLRERGGDVPLLVEHLLESTGRSANITGVTAPAIEVLESLVSGQRPTARAHHPARGRHRAAARVGPRRSPRGAPRTGTATSTAI